MFYFSLINWFLGLNLQFLCLLVALEDAVVDEKDTKSALKRQRLKKNIKSEQPAWAQLISQFSEVSIMIRLFASS